MNKNRYLAVYDYGQGGTWMFFLARAPDEITAKYPELKVMLETPSWMTGAALQAAESRTFDIDAEPTGWLQNLVAKRRP